MKTNRNSEEEEIRGWLVETDDILPKIGEESIPGSATGWRHEVQVESPLNKSTGQSRNDKSTPSPINVCFKAVPQKEIKPSLDILR